MAVTGQRDRVPRCRQRRRLHDFAGLLRIPCCTGSTGNCVSSGAAYTDCGPFILG